MSLRKDEFARRRRQLMRMMGKGGIAILPTAMEKQRNSDVHYFFRPDSDFHYLTGFNEPDSVAVLVPGRAQAEYILFVRDRDPTRETWDGKRAGPDGATRDHGADDAFPIGDIDDILPGLIENCGRVYYTMGLNLEFDHRVIGWVNSLRGQSRLGIHTPQEFVSLDHLLHDMRLYKGRAELGVMRRAAQIAVGAHLRAMRATRPGVYEYQVMAEILHEFHRHNADISYHPIVGGGANACTLHYHANNAELEDGDLLLIDAGCEYQYYASDITRTFPVNGRFSPEQRAVYEVVLDAQNAAIARSKPGNHWNDPHDAAVQAITKGLVRLGLLKGRVPSLIKEGAYRRFFMHRTGHWLGMDVHDVGDYKVGDEWRVLEPGMCLTVEPGIYIPAGSRGVPRRWWNIGVRIEDDVAITAGGCEVLTDGLPRTPNEVERVMRTA
ncbi:MAG TPA: aminopeptidase P N-terminal domain-containing protein [Steroidobacteraceae bacterium]